MHVAADFGNVELVEILLKAGCDLKIADKVSSWPSLCSVETAVKNSLLAVSLEQQA